MYIRTAVCATIRKPHKRIIHTYIIIVEPDSWPLTVSRTDRVIWLQSIQRTEMASL